MLRLGHTLMRLDAGELREAAPVGFVAPDFERRIVHRVVAVFDCGAIRIPLPAMHHDMVADLDVAYVAPDRIDNSRGVAPADVEIRGVIFGFLPCGDDVDRRAERGPYIVEIHAGRHD